MSNICTIKHNLFYDDDNDDDFSIENDEKSLCNITRLFHFQRNKCKFT